MAHLKKHNKNIKVVLFAALLYNFTSINNLK